MANIVWSDESLKWLREIDAYIAQFNPTAAYRTLEGIYQKTQLLKQNPELGFRYEARERENVRILLYGHYRITYQLIENREVYILGVYHAALDIDRYL